MKVTLLLGDRRRYNSCVLFSCIRSIAYLIYSRLVIYKTISVFVFSFDLLSVLFPFVELKLDF